MSPVHVVGTLAAQVAIGLPVAASVGLATTAALVGTVVWLQGAAALLSPMSAGRLQWHDWKVCLRGK